MFGFILGGSTATLKSENMQLSSCVSLNPGFNDIHTDAGDPGSPFYKQNAHTGFLVFAPSDAGIDGVVLDNCQAIDRQGFYLLGDDDPWALAGATAARMQFPWRGYSGTYSATFMTRGGTVTRSVALTSGSTQVTWTGGLAAPISHPFVSLPHKMQYGYMAHNEVGAALAFNQTTRRPITLNDNCESAGHLVARQFGFHRDLCHLTATSPQTIRSGAHLTVEFDRENEDTMGMHDGGGATAFVYPKRPGTYRVHGMIAFETASAGYRRVEVRVDGTAVYTLPVAAVVGERTVCLFDIDVEIGARQVATNVKISIWAEQNSGRSLEIGADRWVKLERVRPA
ncbi:hypothetical protein G7077_03280 [Sphingomonas piscis]|uniref:Uncharacterized protein n=1 Tax=Sphingomonas piscis TaxID=2714943 RepID=A0A6G7YMW1_9SPHN|nr:hypothetical protein [Sphingomonas piscis]QIK78080.1 hypothetical protein G7077_03280 [Sphingomonas piscis]